MLSGVNSLAITISWNDRSSLFKLTSQIQNLTVVGYHKETKKWLDLGSTKTTGTIEEGFITSDELIPDEYEAFTFGSVLENNLPSPNSANYLITPNGDGINDFLFIPDLENYEYNTVQIFNRYGRKVFEAENYTNQFDGAYSLTGPTVGKDSGLPEGVYFYIVNLVDVQLNFQGFLYIDR
jgi:gliding motility-associated-like protein